MRRLPIVVTLHRSGPLGDVQRLQRRVLAAGRIAALRQQVDAFVAISKEIDGELAGLDVPAERRVFIPNGVDVERFRPLPAAERAALRATLGLPAGRLAVFAGRLAPEKRVDQLINLWPAVRARYPDATLAVLGTGEQEADLKRMAGPGVHFAGRIEDVAPYLQTADLFILPSAAEGLSIALLEALAAGLPALATHVGGAPDVIEHGANGWLVPPDAPAALQEAIISLWGDTERRTNLGRQGRERVAREFSLPVVVDRLRALYDQLVPMPLGGA